MLEREIESYLVDCVARQFGGIAYKFTSPNRRGLPDRLVVIPDGIMFFVELKSAKGKLTPNQIREHDRLRKLGAIVYVANSKAEVDSILLEWAP